MSAEAQLRYVVLCWHMHQTLVPGTTSKTKWRPYWGVGGRRPRRGQLHPPC